MCVHILARVLQLYLIVVLKSVLKVVWAVRNCPLVPLSKPLIAVPILFLFPLISTVPRKFLAAIASARPARNAARKTFKARSPYCSRA